MAVTPERLKELWLLLLEDRKILTDAQIQEIIDASEELDDLLFRTRMNFPTRYEAVLRYRRRKQELEAFSTERLEEMHRGIRRAWSARASGHDLSDEFFMSPPIDSDDHIIYEILKERRKEVQSALPR